MGAFPGPCSSAPRSYGAASPMGAFSSLYGMGAFFLVNRGGSPASPSSSTPPSHRQ